MVTNLRHVIVVGKRGLGHFAPNSVAEVRYILKRGDSGGIRCLRFVKGAGRWHTDGQIQLPFSVA